MIQVRRRRDGKDLWWFGAEDLAPAVGGGLLLHLAAARQRNAAVIAALLAVHRAAATVRDGAGRLPCAIGLQAGCSAEAMLLLHSAHPSAMEFAEMVAALNARRPQLIASARSYAEADSTLAVSPAGVAEEPLGIDVFAHPADGTAGEVRPLGTAVVLRPGLPEKSGLLAGQLAVVTHDCAADSFNLAAGPAPAMPPVYELTRKSDGKVLGPFEPEDIATAQPSGRLLLHHAAAHRRPVSVLQVLIAAFPGAVSVPDAGGQLPLAVAAAAGCSAAALACLLQSYPPAMTARDKNGKLPAELAVGGRVEEAVAARRNDSVGDAAPSPSTALASPRVRRASRRPSRHLPRSVSRRGLSAAAAAPRLPCRSWPSPCPVPSQTPRRRPPPPPRCPPAPQVALTGAGGAPSGGGGEAWQWHTFEALYRGLLAEGADREVLLLAAAASGDAQQLPAARWLTDEAGARGTVPLLDGTTKTRRCALHAAQEAASPELRQWFHTMGQRLDRYVLKIGVPRAAAGEADWRRGWAGGSPRASRSRSRSSSGSPTAKAKAQGSPRAASRSPTAKAKRRKSRSGSGDMLSTISTLVNADAAVVFATAGSACAEDGFPAQGRPLYAAEPLNGSDGQWEWGAVGQAVAAQMAAGSAEQAVAAQAAAKPPPSEAAGGLSQSRARQLSEGFPHTDAALDGLPSDGGSGGVHAVAVVGGQGDDGLCVVVPRSVAAQLMVHQQVVLQAVARKEKKQRIHRSLGPPSVRSFSHRSWSYHALRRYRDAHGTCLPTVCRRGARPAAALRGR